MTTVAFCEIEEYPRRVLRKHWPDVPIYEDIRELSGDRLRADGIIADVVCGGFPCQDISAAGSGEGLDGERSGLWREFARLVGDIRPQIVIVENVAALTFRGLLKVLSDLADLRFDAEWSTVSACSVGAPHVRQRLFIVAYPNRVNGRSWFRNSFAQQDRALQTIDGTPSARPRWQARLADPSALYRGADGVPYCMERNRAIGNSVSPDIVEVIGRAIMAHEEE